MNDSASNALETFGSGLMTRVRDQSLAFVERLTAGRMPDAKSKEFFSRFHTLSPGDAEIAKELAVQASDAAIARFLHYLEENEFEVLVRDESGEKHDIVTTSDGLAGELFTKDGWVARFSQYPQ